MPITRSTGKGRIIFLPEATTQPSSRTEVIATQVPGAAADATATRVGTTAMPRLTDVTEGSGTHVTSDTIQPSHTPLISIQPSDSGAADVANTTATMSTTRQHIITRGGPSTASQIELQRQTQPIVGCSATNVRVDGPSETCAPENAKRKQKGSTKSTKAYKIAKAKEQLARVQVELAAYHLAALEAESDDETENASVISKTEVHSRVDNWLQNQQQPVPVLASTNEPQQPPPINSYNNQSEQQQQQQREFEQSYMPTSAEAYKRQVQPSTSQLRTELTQITEAITLAIKSARPKTMELPIFNGAHQDWLAFRAAYYETEKTYSREENVNRFRRNLKGTAKEAVNGLLISNGDPNIIMRTLEIRFGRPESIATVQIDALRALPRLTDSPRDICIFATKVKSAVATLESLNCTYYLHHPEVAKSLVDKLPPTLRYNYYRFSSNQPSGEPQLKKLDKFLESEAYMCEPFAQPEIVSSQSQPIQQKRQGYRVNTVTEKRSTVNCPACDQAGHIITDCEKFKKANEHTRWDIAKKHHLCFRCLRYRNKTHSCRQKTCGINNCKYYHNRLLHFTKKTAESDKKESTETINSTWTPTGKRSYLKIIPVTASGPAGTVNTYALLDDGSTVTLIDDDIAKQIGATGPVDPLRIEAINELKTAESTSRRISVTLKGANQHRVKIQARTVKNLQIATQAVPQNHFKECKHLQSISNFITYEQAKPGILIGQDNCHLLISKRTKRGSLKQPMASLTPLGWVLHGSHTCTLKNNSDFVNLLKEKPDEENIDSLIKQYFAMDSLCINPKKPKSDPEEQALRILEKHTVHSEKERYETALLWKTEDPTLPNNYENSLKRLYSIEKKLDRDPLLKSKYTQQMEALISKGYAEPAPNNKTENRTWYLPHFGVVNPMKPEKLRVVHDAAAKTRGVSLNDLLHKGPDLLQSLPGVVMRFRQHSIAVTADITEMFMQVKLREEDRDALRYLWRRDRRDDQPPEEYRMTSLIFGASSSPATAIFVKNLNAKKYEDIHPEASKAIIEKHYVDDYLDSFKSLDDAIRITTEVRNIHKKASFELKQWKSNSPRLLEAIGETATIDNIELYKTEDRTERVLGLIWKPTTDEFTFNLDLTRIPAQLKDGKKPTKREALRVVMSLFDPLGFASPVTIKAKQLLQEVWRRGTSWDDEIEEDLTEQWRTWLVHLRNLSNVTIPRQYFGYSNATILQLHIFTDASESAYSAVLFWRTISPNGEVDVSLIIAKAKVAPLKLTSIPRLELQAAVMGTRLADAVIEEHERKPDTKTFWTDSKTVLTWIKTGSRSYKPYVAHRLAAIEESSTVNEWRWIPSKLNVADDATRDVPSNFNSHHRWYKGPDFFYEHEDSWPTEQDRSTLTEPTGEERVHHMVVNTQPKLTEALPDSSRFSNWERLRYTTARILQYIQLSRATAQTVHYKRTQKNTEADPDWRKKPVKHKKSQNKEQKTKKEDRKYLPVSAELLIKAEELLMRSSQEESFAQELTEIQKGKPVDKQSRLHQFSIENTDGILRLRSRINAAQHVPDKQRSPMILDGNHQTVKLWIANIHRKLHHSGVEATVNECRQQYWILRLRPITRTIVRQCLHCRLKTALPPFPRTGDLPPCRLAHHQRPFKFTGVDYFGPQSITVGRSHQKRYVAIFTCLTTRAIHLEIAGSLSSSSAIMALRRMIARRGCPTEIWSDNGTNLKGADKELRQAISDDTTDEASKHNISWRFIPPGAPFMGGAWERMVRSVKTALTATLHERHPTEEVLNTLLAEVEYTVNSRPLTHVSVSADDPEALTPNHFLLGGPGRVPTPGKFNQQTASKSSWQTSQYLANIFWERWMKEYLPDLQNRREPHGKGPSVRVGDLVQLADANQPRNTWVRGRVITTFPGPDNIVRTADIQTKNGVLRRPVRKLLILPIEDNVVSAPVEGATKSHGGRNVRDDSEKS